MAEQDQAAVYDNNLTPPDNNDVDDDDENSGIVIQVADSDHYEAPTIIHDTAIAKLGQKKQQPELNVILAGWGQKEGGVFKTWKRRFFVLRNRKTNETFIDDRNWKATKATIGNAKPSTNEVTHLMMYFRNRHSMESSAPTGVVPIVKGKTLISLAPQKSPKCLKIETPGLNRVYYVVPEDDVQLWMDAVTHLVGDPSTQHLRRMTANARIVNTNVMSSGGSGGVGGLAKMLGAIGNPADMIMDVLKQVGLDQSPAEIPDVAQPQNVAQPQILSKLSDFFSRPGLEVTVDYRPVEAKNPAKGGDRLFLFYTGTIAMSSKAGHPGMLFDSNIGKEAYPMRLGSGQTILGWDLGLAGMCEGEKRTLVIAPEYGYGATGAGGVIPPNATLRFTIERIVPGNADRKVIPGTNSNSDADYSAKGMHKNCVCDLCHADNGKFDAIAGTKYSKIGCDTPETQYDLCSSHFGKLSKEQQVLFNVIAKMGDTPVAFKDTDVYAKVVAEEIGMSTTLAELKLDSSIPLPMQYALAKIHQDKALSEDEKKNLFELLPKFQQSLDEFHQICIELFVNEKKFHLHTTAAEEQQGFGTHKLDYNRLATEWKGKLGQTKDGRSLLNTFTECRELAAQMLKVLDPAVQRTWNNAWDEEVKSSNAPIDLETVIPQVEGPKDTAQPVPFELFRNQMWLSSGPYVASQIGPEICSFFNKFVEEATAGQHGTEWLAYNQAYQGAMQAGDVERAAEAKAVASEMDIDTTKLIHSLVIQLGTTAGVPNGQLVYSMYLDVRVRYANKDFPMHVRQALMKGFPAGLEAAGVEIRLSNLKGNTRRDAKALEYRKEGMPEPATQFVKDILRMTLAVTSVHTMIECHDAIQKGMQVVSVKNRLSSKATRDVLMIVRLPDGILAEIQIHLKAILTIKKHTHKPYKVDRLDPLLCPCDGSLVVVPEWNLERMTKEAIKLTASYTQ